MKRIILLLTIAMNFGIAFAAKYAVKVGEFTHLQVDDNINVVYSNNPDSVGMVCYETTPDMANKIMFSTNNKGRLRIQVMTGAVDRPNLPVVHVYSSFLTKIENSSDSTLTIASIAPAPEIEIKLTDNGKIKATGIEATKLKVEILTGKGVIVVSGQCVDASLKSIGTGEIQADKLKATNVTATISGTGCIGCNVSGKLVVKGLGTGKVYYSGKPQEVKTHKLGSIKAIPLEEE